ncbi:MAG TPA: alkaline phosphatase family protein [Coleofasciculaceae cyanobacterium]
MLTRKNWNSLYPALRKPLWLWSFGLSLMAIGCSAQGQTPHSTASQMPTTPAPLPSSVPTAADRAIPHYDHVFIIVAENKRFDQVINSPSAPNLSRFAKTYGLATHFYGEVHPSEANYVAMLAGSTFGIHDDDAYYCQAGSADGFCPHAASPGYASHTIASRSLLDQLQEKGLTWKGYFESLPSAGSKVVVAPSPDRALYASKHNGFLNFKSVQDDPNLSHKIVDLQQLGTDLQTGQAPNYSHIVFNQCHEMHGLSECPNTQALIQTGDTMMAQAVEQIISSSLWSSPNNNAIVITWDEDDNPMNKTAPQGCCGFDPASAANFGGGQIPTIVITNHGSQGIIDPTPYNHYSLLRTLEDAFGIYEYLNQANATDQGVKPMSALFALPSK